MKLPMKNLLAFFSFAILITTSSCNRAPASITVASTAKFTPAIAATSNPTATQLPPTVTPTVTKPSPAHTPSSPTFQVSNISAGSAHTCMLTPSGGGRCWGDNENGELGDGTTIHRSMPVDVVGLDSKIVSVDAGGSQTCALTDVGWVKCWGLNESGQLGDGTETDSSTPVDVVNLSRGVVSVSVGGGRACAVTAAGGVKCWGLTWYGQLGDGKTNFYSTPVDVPGLDKGVAMASTGGNHICVLTTTGGVKCWGWNASGQLGDGTINHSSTPVDVVGLERGVAAISTGSNHTCALTIAGGVKCWGDNTWGQVGDATNINRSTPVDVIGMSSGTIAVTAGSGHTCGLTISGGVKCWGANSSGDLGNGTTNHSFTPVDVPDLGSGVTAVTAGRNHTCALMASGEVKCWGDNRVGHLGDGVPPICVTPVDVMALGGGVSAISVGSSDACVLMDAGRVKCWGSHFLTGGATSELSTPVDLAGLGREVKALSLGSVFNICALTSRGEVECLSDRGQDQVEVVRLGSEVRMVSTGFYNCAVTVSGGVMCWGEPEYGGLGDGTTNPSSTPVEVIGLDSGVSSVTVGFSHSCVLMSSGGVKCWGWNAFGQLGDGTNIDRLTPMDVVGLGREVTAIAAGSNHTCALTASGGVKCWGQNEEGQVGNGTHSLMSILAPVDVVDLSSTVIKITAGEDHTCALTTSGGVKCWGWNAYGQLGDGKLSNHSTPVDVIGLSSGVSAIDAGLTYNCVITVSGGVKCWGDDSIGQMGDGRILWSSVPVDMAGYGSQRKP